MNESAETNHAEKAAVDNCCANCGKVEIDDIKLNACPHCDLVKYCSDQCLKSHRCTHEVACKERAAELRDELLFKQPESSHLGECPICFLPMPLDDDGGQRRFYAGAVIWICLGCLHAKRISDKERGDDEEKCPFCRVPSPSTDEESKKDNLRRAAVNDLNALTQLGMEYHIEGDYAKAIEYWTKAAELGCATAAFKLSLMHGSGESLLDSFTDILTFLGGLMNVNQNENREMQMFWLEEAAIAGHADARVLLGIHESFNINMRFDREVRHLIIAANLGESQSIRTLKDSYKNGHVTKEDFAAALRAQHAAVSAMKSPQREAAKAVYGES